MPAVSRILSASRKRHLFILFSIHLLVHFDRFYIPLLLVFFCSLYFRLFVSDRDCTVESNQKSTTLCREIKIQKKANCPVPNHLFGQKKTIFCANVFILMAFVCQTKRNQLCVFFLSLVLRLAHNRIVEKSGKKKRYALSHHWVRLLYRKWCYTSVFVPPNNIFSEYDVSTTNKQRPVTVDKCQWHQTSKFSW